MHYGFKIRDMLGRDLEAALDLAALRRRLPDPEMRKMLRRRCGLSQQALGDAIGLTRIQIARYENATRTPRGDALRVYVEALDRLAAEVAEAVRPNGNGPAGTGPQNRNTDDRTGEG